MGNFLKSNKSGMVGYRVQDENLAQELVKFFEEMGSNLAWRNTDSYGHEVLISEVELQRIQIRASDVTIEMRKRGFNLNWPAIYGDPHFTYL
jgi:hypothetical protein